MGEARARRGSTAAKTAFEKFFESFTDSAWEDVTVADAFAAGFKAGSRRRTKPEAAVLAAALEWYRSRTHRDVREEQADLWNALWAFDKTEGERDAP